MEPNFEEKVAENNDKSWNYYDGFIVTGVMLIAYLGSFIENLFSALKPYTILSMYWFIVSIILLFLCKNAFRMFNETDSSDFAILEKYRAKTFAAFGHGSVSLITACLYFVFFSFYESNYLLGFFGFLSLFPLILIYLYIAIVVIHKKTGVRIYFNICTRTIIITSVLLLICYLLMKNIAFFQRSYILSFSELTEKGSMADIFLKIIPILIIKPTIGVIYKTVEAYVQEKGIKPEPANQESQGLLKGIFLKIKAKIQECNRKKTLLKKYFLLEAIKDYFIWILLVFSIQLIKNYYLVYGTHFSELLSYLKNIDWLNYISSVEVGTYSAVGFFLMGFTLIRVLQTNSDVNRKEEIFSELKLYNRIFLIAVINTGWIFAPLFALLSVVFIISIYVIKSEKMLISFNYILSRIILTLILTIICICISLFCTINSNSTLTLFSATLILYCIAKCLDFIILILDLRTKFTQKMREKFNIK